MKKTITVLLAIIVSLAIVGITWAQEVTPVPMPKQKTIEELQWQAKALQNEFNYLQERLKTLTSEFQAVQAELKAKQPTPAPKPSEKSKEEPIAKEKGKK
jgi:peptidoglycan hydrolase CwlO-like protein